MGSTTALKDEQLIHLVQAISSHDRLSPKALQALLKQYPRQNRGYYRRSQIIQAYQNLADQGIVAPLKPQLIASLRLKPIRTLSGVAPVTVLTHPYPCPGKCIFCPNDVRMPKSYIATEPGAQRAAKNHFHPYLQVYNRLLAFKHIGHHCDKVELLVLGGTWSVYPLRYQKWFIHSCFQALNDFGAGLDHRHKFTPALNPPVSSDHQHLPQNYRRLSGAYNRAIGKLYPGSLPGTSIHQPPPITWSQIEAVHRLNRSSNIRCIGLVLETRPDFVTPNELIRLRRFGCTKVQIGLQSLNDRILSLNRRGHDLAASRRAMALLRLAGFKLHVHIMPNLYGAGPDSDIHDYRLLFTHPDFKPDEIKIYPTSLIDHTPLMHHYQSGRWRPYSQSTLRRVILECMRSTPEYCRISRVIRDIPSNHIVSGNKHTNFRQIVEAYARKHSLKLHDIRSREIKNTPFDSLTLKTFCYSTSTGVEYFLQMVTPSNRIAAFLRLSLPNCPNPIPELNSSAIIREVHVYGPAVPIGKVTSRSAQHSGLGKSLILAAHQYARLAGFSKISVISAVGTHHYYRKFGYRQGKLYQSRHL